MGHPVIGEQKWFVATALIFARNLILLRIKRLLWFCRDRAKTEVSKMLPVFLEASQKLYEKDKNLCFVIPTVKTVAKMVKDWRKRPSFR